MVTLEKPLAEPAGAKSQPAVCTHCHDKLPAEPIAGYDEWFCCQGCYLVYGLLHQSGLQNYYALNPEAGRRIKNSRPGEWDYLALPEVQEKLLDYHDSTWARVTLNLPNIHCSACIWLLENLGKIEPAVKNASVDFPRKQVSLYWQLSELSLPALVQILQSLGYPPDIRLDEPETRKKPAVNRRLVVRLGVAGFCFGNIMLLSLPEYLDSTELLESQFRQYFQWISLALSLPVVFYAATEFYRSAWQGLRYRQINMDVPIVVGIAVLFLRSAYEVVAQVGPGYFDSLAGLLFFLLIGRWYQSKTYAALTFDRDYKSYFPVAVTRLTPQGEETTLLKNLNVGDKVLIRYGELIPADSQLCRGQGQLDYAFVTGESELQARAVGDKLFAGGRQMGGPLEIELQKKVAQSYLTQLWNQQGSGATKNLSSALANAVSRWFTVFILVLSSATALYWYLVNPNQLWQAVTAVLIVACPCALALSVPFTYGTALRYLGKWGLYLKNAQVVEQLATVTTLVFDKTGTITNKETSNALNHLGKLAPEEQAALAAICRASTHPLSQRMYQYLVNQLGKRPLPAVAEFAEQAGRGIRAQVEGVTYYIGSAEYVGAEKSTESRVWVKRETELLGYLAFESHYRSGLFATLKQLGQRFRLWLLSGDNAAEESLLKPYFNSVAFNQKPHHKLAAVQQLQAEQQRVLMLGDGLNDAAALEASDVGISISDDVYQFTPASDAILTARSLGQLPAFLQFSRRSRRIVYGAFALSLAYNVVGISFAASGLLTPLISAILMPLSSVTVVAFCSLGVRLAGKNEGIIE